MLCIVVVWMRRSRKRDTFPIHHDMAYNTTEQDIRLISNHNPSCDVTKVDSVAFSTKQSDTLQ